MKTNSIRNIFVLSIILIFVVACRYEDGPLISLRSSEKRLIGTWRVTGFEKNGVSVLDEWRSQYDWRFTFFDQYSDRYFLVSNCNCYLDTADVILTSAGGSWIFYDDNDTKLNFAFGFKYFDNNVCVGDGIYPLTSGKWMHFDVLKLKASKLGLNSIDSLDNEYFVQFEKE